MMKQVLEDSRNLEALTLNYLSFGFIAVINNLWRWLALSFWKSRASAAAANSPQPESSHDDEEEEEEEAPSVVPMSVVDEVEGPTPTKGNKFTVVYYYEEEEEVVERRVEEYPESKDEWWPWESWEGLLKLRLGENHKGWYTSQDLKAINGNVVRLWHGGDNHLHLFYAT